MTRVEEMGEVEKEDRRRLMETSKCNGATRHV